MADKKKAKKEIEAFEAEEDDDLEDLEDEDEAEEDEDDSDDSDEDEDDDDSDEDDEDEDEPTLIDVGFAPFVIGDDQTWDIGDVIGSADKGEAIYLYAPPDVDENQPAKWYKLQPIQVGEVGTVTE